MFVSIRHMCKTMGISHDILADSITTSFRLPSAIEPHNPSVAMDDVALADKGSKEATFAALAVGFNSNDKVKDIFLKGPMENLEDFRYD